MARHDAEVATDVGDDGADRATADLGGDLLGRGYADRSGELVAPATPRGGSGGGRSAVAGSAWRRRFGVQSGGGAGDPGFERLGTEQATGDAREDQGDVAGAERVRIVTERGGELPAVVDELADEADEAAGAADPQRAWPARRSICAYCAVMPPSITSSEPVTQDDSSDARNSTPLAISRAVPSRPIGVRSSSAWRTAGSLKRCKVSGVSA